MTTLVPRSLQEVDRRCCIRLNRFAAVDPVRAIFTGVSRLGDGVAWYLVMASLPVVYGFDGLVTSLKMAIAGLAALALYKAIKSRTTRLRPFMVDPAILVRARPLDLYSFPSGHTLQAVSFTIVACNGHPVLAWVLVPFAVLVGLSRPVLGLHFPSDVVIGAALGALVAGAVVALPFA